MARILRTYNFEDRKHLFKVCALPEWGAVVAQGIVTGVHHYGNGEIKVSIEVVNDEPYDQSKDTG